MNRLQGNILIPVFFVVFLSFPVSIVLGQDDGGADVVRISDIDINGADAVSEKEIKENIGTEFPSIKFWVKDPEFDEYILRQDMIRIEKLYADYGYYDADAEYELKYSEDKSRVEVTINIGEGKPVILTDLDVDIQGELNKELRKEILDSVPLEVDETFSPRKYQETKGTILNILANNGYPKADIEGEALVNREGKSAEVTFAIEPGVLYGFGSISVDGNEEAETYVIRREVTYEKGEVYSTAKLDETRTRIFQLGLFNSVIIDVNFDEGEKTANTVVRVDERKFGSIKVGVGFGTEDLFRGQIILTQRNFLGGGRRLELGGKFSFLTQRVETVFTQPYIIGGGSELIGSFSLRRDDLPGFVSENILGAVGVRKKVGRTLNILGSFSVLISSLSDVSEVLGVDRTEQCEDDCFLTFFNAAIERNTTDNILNPTRGTVASVGVESSFQALGSDVNYLLGTVDLRGYKEFFDVVFAKRITLGVIQPFGDSETFDVPIFKRFFAGGSTTHRGFPFQRLGPLAADEDPVGGNSLILGNVEARFPVYKDFGGVVFFDYGNVYEEEFEYKLDDLKYAVGVGLRYNTLIGPLRVDVGYALNPEPEFDRLQYFLSVGQAF